MKPKLFNISSDSSSFLHLLQIIETTIAFSKMHRVSIQNLKS